MSARPYARLAVSLTCSLALAAGCQGPTERPSLPALGELRTMQDAAQVAEQSLGVPGDLLLAMAWQETRWQRQYEDADHGSEVGLEEGSAHVPHTLGVVGLRPWLSLDGTQGDVVAFATELLGVNATRIDEEPVVGVLAAAVVMRALAEQRYGTEGLPPSDSPAAWDEIIADFAGLQGEARQAHADAVLAVLRTGVQAIDPDGNELRLAAREVPVVRALGVAREYGGAEYPGARWVPASSTNYTSGRSGESVRYVVIHTTQGSYAGAISWFQNPSANVSAHYVIRSSDGEVTQMLSHGNTGWHAGNSTYNRRSIGIEHEGFVADPGRWYTASMYESSGRLTRWVCARHSIPMDRAHIIGHFEVPGASHTDPGGGWDWPRYMRLVSGTPDRPAYAAAYRAQDIPTAMVSGERAVAWVEFRNDGANTWRLDRTFLGAVDDGASPFFDVENWVNDHRATPPDHSDYATGSTGRFTFMITAPEVETETVVSDTFRLVEEGVTWFGDEVTLSIRVSPRAPAAPVDADGDGAVLADDCDDADPARYPGAVEVCGDSIDQDCDGADAACSTEDGGSVPSADAGIPPPLRHSDAGTHDYGERPDAGGCTVGAAGQSGRAPLGAMLLGLALVAARRRRRLS